MRLLDRSAGETRRKVEPVKRRPDRDPDLDAVLDKIKKMSPKEVSEASGGWIAAATVRNWRRNQVRCPLNYTVKAAYRAAGYEMVPRRIKT